MFISYGSSTADRIITACAMRLANVTGDNADPAIPSLHPRTAGKCFSPKERKDKFLLMLLCLFSRRGRRKTPTSLLDNHFVNVCVDVCEDACVYVYMCVYICEDMHVYVCMLIYVRTCVHACVCLCM